MGAIKELLGALARYFEPISLAYHISFLSFLVYLLFFRPKHLRVDSVFIRALGLYVMLYGAVLFFLGDWIINRDV